MVFVSLFIVLELINFFQGMRHSLGKLTWQQFLKTSKFIFRTFADIMNLISSKYQKLHCSVSAKVFTIWHIWGFLYFAWCVSQPSGKSSLNTLLSKDPRSEGRYWSFNLIHQCSLPAAKVVAQSMFSEQQLDRLGPPVAFTACIWIVWSQTRRENMWEDQKQGHFGCDVSKKYLQALCVPNEN